MTTTREAWRKLRPLALASAVAACTSSQPFLWVESLPSSRRPETEHRVVAGDVLGVRVWKHDDMSTERARVRDDGKVSLAFLQDVPAAGMTLAEFSSRVTMKLKKFVVDPVVTVTLEERPLRISVLGEVTRPGTYDLEQGAGVLEALAAAGGMTQWASRDGLYVLRHGYGPEGNPARTRIRFRYDRLVGGAEPDALFRLQPGDVVVVE